jgi:hypothetical protein
MKVKSLFLIVFLSLILTSCVRSKETSINSYYSLPIKVEKKPSKEGRSCANFVFLFSIFYSDYDISVEAARQNGEISEIVSVETEKKFFRPFYYRICTIVKGN